ncbi:YdeI/OmpD-associated family protein [uncultured Maribacter sp.]|uniref:YdeI/OmpD-associated family protein n=1 Tax=uncultured Maribacter sp. TaxID=431308 RepID=UPI0030DA5D22
MEYLVKDEKLELKYEPGKGAWTYHIQIPNTKHLVGKWGSMKVSGTIDNYKIERINLAKLGDQDKLISINANIRKAISKSGGDTVTVSLYLLTLKEQITDKEVLETFKDSGVLKAFKKLTKDGQNEIIEKITSLKSEDKQVKMILKYIDQLSKNND